MQPEPTDERPSWLVEEEPRPDVLPPTAWTDGTLDPGNFAKSEAEPPAGSSMVSTIGPVLLIGSAILLGALGAVGGALYTTMNQPEPSPYEQAEQGPANDAGTVPVRKGIRKSTDRFGR